MSRKNRRPFTRFVSLWIILCHLGAMVPAVWANPEGGTVVGGSATIDQAVANTTTINQASDRAIINWRGFSNTQNEAIRFNQPGAGSVALNRVTGGDPSVIEGSLSATGKVFLLNPNGVLFGSTARVNVNGLAVSTLEANDDEFMSGSSTLSLRQDPSKPLRSVVNKGLIEAGSGGVSLIAPVVNNAGTIRATNGGSVNLGAGRSAEISLDEDNLMTLNVRPDEVAGDVRTSKEAASDLLQTVVNNRNMVEAGSVAVDGDEVTLGGAEGIVMNEGTIETDGAPSADAGRVHLGSSRLTVLAPDSTISANGQGEDSDGGEVMALSQGKTMFAPRAKIESKGGDSGDGGLVETSGDEGLYALGDVDTRAENGYSGTWLLDPDFLAVISGGTGGGSQDSSFNGTDPVGIFGGDPNINLPTVNTVTDGKINQQLLTTNVILEATGHISINAGVIINLNNNHDLLFHVTNSLVDASPQISGAGSGTAQIRNVNLADTGRIAFKVDAGVNTGTLDLSAVSLDGTSGGVFIKNSSVAGNIIVDQIQADGASGIVNIEGNGAILRTVPSSVHGISAPNIFMKANSIGLSNAPILTMSPKVLVDQTPGAAAGDVYLSNSLRAVTVANVEHAGISGSYSLIQQRGIGGVEVPNVTIGAITINLAGQTIVGQVFTGGSGTALKATDGTVTINSEGNIGVTPGIGTSIEAASASLTAVQGISIPTAEKTLVSVLTTVNTANANNAIDTVTGNINVFNGVTTTYDALNTAAVGTITLNNTDGVLTIGSATKEVKGLNDVTLINSGTDATDTIVLVGKTTAGTANSATITANSGSITGGGLVTARNGHFSAPVAIGVGGSGQVKTAVQFLDLSSLGAAGSISASNSGSDVTVAAKSTAAVLTDPAGFINILETAGTMTVGTVNGVTGVETTKRDISLGTLTSGNVRVVSDVLSKLGAGNIAIVSANSILLEANVSTEATGGATFVDLIARSGSITQPVASTVTGGSVLMDATAGIGTGAGARVATATSNIQLGGLSVGGTLIVNAGDDFVTNGVMGTGVAARLIGTNADVIDVVQNDAALTIDTLASATVGNFAAVDNFLVVAGGSAAQTKLQTTGSTKYISAQTTTSGAITVSKDVQTVGGNIGLVSATGDIAVGANITTQSSSGSSLVDVVARSGKITHTAAAALITAGKVALAATGGIAAAATGTRLLTSTTTLKIGDLSVGGTPVVNAGDDFVGNSGPAVTVSAVVNDNGAAGGALDLTQTGANLTVGSSAIGDFDFSPAGITSTARAGLINLDAASTISVVTLTSGDIIVTAADPVQSNAGNIGLISAGSILLNADVRTASTLALSTLGQIDLIALAGTITDPNATATVAAADIALAASGNIGAADKRLLTQGARIQIGGLSTSTNGAAAVAAPNTGNDFIANSVKALTFAGTSTGNIDLTETGGGLTIGTLTLGAFAPAAGDSAVAVTVPVAQNGLIDTGSGKTISLVQLDSGFDITVSNPINSKQGDIGIISAKGIIINADVFTDTSLAVAAGAGNSNLIDLIALAGTITDPAGTGTIASNKVAVSASGNIGATGATPRRLLTQTSNLQIGGLFTSTNGAAATAAPNTGKDYIANSGAQNLTLAGTSSDDIDVTETGATLTIGALTLGAFDPATPGVSAVKVTAPAAQVGLINSGATKIISLVQLDPGFDIVVSTGNAVRTNLGDIGIVSARGIVLNADVLTDTTLALAAGSNNNLIDLIALAGTITDPNGTATVAAKNIALSASGNIGATGATPRRLLTQTSNLQLGGLSTNIQGGGATAAPNTGKDYIANSGTQALTVAGTSSDDIDITETGATLTIGALQLGAFNPSPTSAANVSAPAVALSGLINTGANRTISLVELSNFDITVSTGNEIQTNTGNIGIISAKGIILNADVFTDVDLATAAANGNFIDLIALAGTITDPNGTAQVASGSVAVAASGDIGATGATPRRLLTQTSNLQLGGLSTSINGGAVTAAPNTGKDFIANTGVQNLVLAGSSMDDIDVTESGASLTIGVLGLGAFDPAPTSAVKVTATSQAGLIDLGAGKTISLVNLVAGAGVIGDIIVSTGAAGNVVKTNKGDIGIVAAKSIVLNANVFTDSTLPIAAGATNTNLIDLIALTGTITDPAGTATVASNKVAVAAMGNIGATGATPRRLLTQTSNLQLGGLSTNIQGAGVVAAPNSGKDYIANSGTQNLTLAGTSTDDIDVTESGAALTIGALQLGAFDPAPTSAANISAPAQQVGLIVTGAGNKISLVELSAFDITVSAGNAVRTNLGDIGIISAKGIILNADVLTDTTLTLAATTNNNLIDLIALAGTITDPNGTATVASRNVALSASGNIGATGATPRRLLTQTANLQLGGLSTSINGGAVTAAPNTGKDYIANSGTQALTVAGTSSDDIDVTQTGATFTIGTLTLGVFNPSPTSAVNVSAPAAQVGLINTGLNKTISLVELDAGFDITVANAVRTNKGDIGIISAKGMILNANVLTDTTTALAAGATNSNLIDLIALAGTITDPAGTATVASNKIAVTASGDIGATGARLLTQASNLQLGGLSTSINGGATTAAPNTGKNFIANSGAQNITLAGTSSGDIDVTETGAVLTIGTLTLGAFDPAPTSAAKVTGTQQIGLIDTGLGETISLVGLSNFDIIVSAGNAVKTNKGDIAIVSAKGIVLNADVFTDTTLAIAAGATNANLIDLIALAGTITDPNGTATVASRNIAVSASGDIGTATRRLLTQTANLQLGGLSTSINGGATTAAPNTGKDFIANTGTQNLTLAGTSSDNIDVTESGATLTIGALTLGAFDPAPTSAANITAAAQVGLIDSGLNKTISLVQLSNFDIVVSAGNAVQTNLGDIGIISAKGIVLDANVLTDTTLAAAAAAPNANLIDLIAINGTITDPNGTATIASRNIAVQASGDIGTATRRLLTQTSNLQLGGLAVALNGVPSVPTSVNTGKNFIANSGTQALTLAGTSSDNIDVTETGAGLTIGALTLGAFDPAAANSAAKVTATAQVGLIDTGLGKTISLVELSAFDITVSTGNAVRTNKGDIGIISTQGVVLNANVLTDVDLATAAGPTNSSLIDVIALAGTITDPNGTATVASSKIGLSASGNIGSSARRLLTQASAIQLGGLAATINGVPVATVNGGLDFISNSGTQSVIFAGTSAENIDILQTGADLIVGTLTLGDFDPANPTSAGKVTGTQQVGLTDTGLGKTISLVTVTTGNIIVSAASPVQSNKGNIGFISAQGIVLDANVLTELGAAPASLNAAGQNANQIDLIALNGAITDPNATATVASGNLALSASGDIGTASKRLLTQAANVQLGGLSTSINGGATTAAPNTGKNLISNSGVQNLTVAGTSSDDIDIAETGAALTIGTLTLGDFDPNPTSAAKVTATAQVGLTGTGLGKTISLVELSAFDLTVNNAIKTNKGDIGIISARSIVVSSDIFTDTNLATAAGATNTSLIDLIALSGTITDTNGSTVASNKIALAASAGIGAATARLRTQTSNLQLGGLSTSTFNGPTTAAANGGNDFVANSGVQNLTLAGTNTANIDVTETGAGLTIGTLTLGAFDPATPNLFNPSVSNSVVKVTAAQQVGLIGTGAGNTISLVELSNFDITVGAGAVVRTNVGDIGIVSAKGLVLDGNVLTDVDLATAAGATNNNLIDLIALAGTITDPNGTATVASRNIAVSASGDIGTATRRLLTQTSNLQLGGLSTSIGGGATTAAPNTGKNFIANSGLQNLTLAGTSTDNIDVTESGAGLTIGTLTLGAFDPTNPDSAAVVTSSAQVGLINTGLNKTISLLELSGFDITVSTGNAVRTNKGDIGIVSSKGIILDADVFTDTTLAIAAGATNTNLIDLIALNGTITDPNGTATVASNRIAVASSGNIGTATRRLLTQTSNLQLGGLSTSINGGATTAAPNTGKDFIANSGTQGLTLAGTSSDDIDVTETGAGLTIGSLTLGAFDPAAASSAVKVTATQQNGLIDTGAGRTISLVELSAFDITVTAGNAVRSNKGDIGIVSAQGIVLDGNVLTDVDVATAAGATNSSLIDLIALAGTITDPNGTATVASNKIAVTASGDIGTATRRLLTQTSNLQLGGLSTSIGGGATTAAPNTGRNFIANSGTQGLTLAGTSTDDIDVTETGAGLTIGTLTLGAFNPTSPNSAAVVTAAQQIGLIGTGLGQTISLVQLSNFDITVSAGNAVQTNKGNIGLISAKGIVLDANVLTDVDLATAAGATNANLIDLIALNGTITDPNATATVASRNIALSASGDIGTATRRLLTQTSNLQLGGLSTSINGAAVAAAPNTGKDFIANSGVQNLTLAGTSSDNIDVTEAGAALTIGSLTLGVFDPAPANSAAVVSTTQQNGLIDTGLGKTISLVELSSFDVTVTAGNAVRTNKGDIGIVSTRSIILDGNVLTDVDAATAAGATNASLIDLIALAGTITDPNGTATVASRNVALSSSGDIGTATRRLLTQTSNLQLGGLSVTLNGFASTPAAVNTGQNFVANSGTQALTVAGTSSDNIDLTETGAALTVGSLTLGAFDPAAASSVAKVTATQQNGLIDTGSGKTISLVNLAGGDIVVSTGNTVKTNKGNIGLISAQGIVLNGNVFTDLDLATAAGATNANLIDLIALAGTITDPAGTATVASNKIAVSASGDIGTILARLLTQTSNLQLGGLSTNTAGGGAIAAPNTGSDFIGNSGGLPLIVAGVNTAGDIDITQTAGDLNVGSFAINAFAFDPATPNSAVAVTSAAQVGLTDTGVGRTVSLSTLGSGNITLDALLTNATGTVNINTAGTFTTTLPPPTNGVVANTLNIATNGTLNLQGAPNIGSPTTPLSVSVANFNATAPLGSINANFTNPAGTTVNLNARDNIQIEQLAGSLFVNNLTAGGTINATSRFGSILDASGGTMTNIILTGGGTATLMAAGTIGTRAGALSVNLNQGALAVSAAGSDGFGVGVNVRGTILPNHTLILLPPLPTESVFFESFAPNALFNGRVISAPEMGVFQASSALVALSSSTTPVGLPVTTEQTFDVVANLIQLTAPYLASDYVEEDRTPAPRPAEPATGDDDESSDGAPRAAERAPAPATGSFETSRALESEGESEGAAAAPEAGSDTPQSDAEMTSLSSANLEVDEEARRELADLQEQ